MSEQGENIVVGDTPHKALPPELNQNDLKSRINELIASPPSDNDNQGDQVGQDGNQPEEGLAPDEPDKPGSESDQLGLSDADLETEADEEPERSDASAVDEEETPPVETLDAKALAEKLGLPIEELYAMRFPYGEDGDAITLGELKDAGIRARTIDAEGESLSQERDSFINDRMKSRSELQNIVSLLPEIPAELMQAAQQQQHLTMQQERVSLLEAIPEWSDPGIEQPARAAIQENLNLYGFSELEAAYMVDHRLVKLLHDYTRLRSKLVAPKAQVSKMKKTTRRKPRSKQSRKREGVEQANRIGRSDVRGAINKLLPRD